MAFAVGAEASGLALGHHSDTPMRHRAGGVLLCDLLEGVPCWCEPEGVEQGHSVVEGGLCLACARHVKARFTDLAGKPSIVGQAAVASAVRETEVKAA
jgi:hypothetical protein